MLELSSHLLSKVIPESERAYQKALTVAYGNATKLLMSADTFTQARLRVLIKEITDELYLINKDYQAALPYDVENIVNYDSRYTYDELDSSILERTAHLVALPKETLKEIANLGTMTFFRINKDGIRIASKPITAETMLNSIAKNNAEKVRGIIMAEYAIGTPTSAIARKLRPFITTENKRNVRTVTRTLLSEAASKAQNRFYDENADYIDGYIYVATLDSRTSQLCSSLDGRRFKTKAVWYTPPLHPNCRSKLQAVPNGYELGERPIMLPDGTIERVSDSNFTYKDALKRFPQLSNKKLINTDQYVKGLGYN